MNKAREHLKKWIRETTPEKFVEDHKGLVFNMNDNSPRVQLVEYELKENNGRKTKEDILRGRG